jgi:hypothetical protein
LLIVSTVLLPVGLSTSSVTASSDAWESPSVPYSSEIDSSQLICIQSSCLIICCSLLTISMWFVFVAICWQLACDLYLLQSIVYHHFCTVWQISQVSHIFIVF